MPRVLIHYTTVCIGNDSRSENPVWNIEKILNPGIEAYDG